MKRILIAARINAISQKVRLVIASCIVVLFSTNISKAQSGFSFTTIDFPGSNSTAAADINATGQIVGVYAMGGRHFGFLLSGGTFTTIDPPGASYSEAQGINDAGQIVGWYNDAGDVRHYFLFSGGTYSSFDAPSPFTSGTVDDIDNGGRIVGQHNSNGMSGNGFFIYGNTFTSINFPGASATYPTKINELGQIVGHYGSCAGNNGFLLADGRFTVIVYPGANSTAADGINNSGQIVGGYVVGGTFHGYSLSGSTFTTVDFPGSANTEIAEINDSGVIVGEYWGASGFSPHGFLAAPISSRQLTALDPANVWIGLKNSDDVGTRFDLLAEVFKNSTPIGSGQLYDVAGGSSGFNNAALRTINLALSSPQDFNGGDTLSVRLSVRIAASGHRSGTARLWFNDAAANSRFGATIGEVTSAYFLLDGFALGTEAGPGPKKKIDVFVDRNAGGNPFTPFGTWIITP
jgi:probable HAF family extracellular repeat protein